MNPLQKKFEQYSIILGSQSPRRKQLLEGLAIDFTVKTLHTDESYPTNLQAEEVVDYLAIKKFNAFIPSLASQDFLITADTIVVHNNLILHKPTHESEAIQTLRTLSASIHKVITGVCYGTAESHRSFSAETIVSISELSKEEIDYYVHTYKPYDKAGAYGVQEWIGYIGVEKIEGSFYNVMGLPIQLLYQNLMNYELH